MAIRIPKKLRDLNATLADLGIYVGTTPPSNPVTYEQWLEAREGCFAFIDLSGLIAQLSLDPTAAAMLIGTGVPVVQMSGATFVTPAVASMLIAAGAPYVVTDRPLSVVSASMRFGVGVPVVQLAGDKLVVPSAAVMLMTASAPTVLPDPAVSPSAAAMLMASAVPTVNIGAGGGGPSVIAGFPKTTNGGAGYRTSIASPSVDLTGHTNVLLIATVAWVEDTGSAGTTSLSGLGLAWTQRASVGGGGSMQGVRIFSAWAASAPAAGTVTATFQNANKAIDVLIGVYAFDGANQTVGATATSIDGSLGVSITTTAANSRILFGNAQTQWGQAPNLVAAGCAYDVWQNDTDSSTYWYGTGVGQKTAVAGSVGSYTVGFYDATPAPSIFQAAIEVKAA